ncbi:MAG: GNAT family N-acetyltransferase [Saprospiraceae bacterium]|nr:GNAT family N-acetyltransferase [Candidatus Opimibacter iunctus]
MNLLPLTHADVNLITELLPPGWDTALPSISFYTTSDFCFPMKLTVGNIIVGTGTAIIHNDVAWLAHIIVHPDHRNQGIGQAITKALIEIANTKCCTTIYLLATELGEPVYKKVGFETEAEYLFFKSERPVQSADQDEHILPYSNDYLDQIAILDQQVSGEDRMFHLKEHLTDGFVFVIDDHLEGYYLPTLGDGLIIAATTAAGLSLMKFRLATKDFAVFPADNKSAEALLRQYPFTEVRRQKRMRLGINRHWEPSMIYNRIGGNLG